MSSGNKSGGVSRARIRSILNNNRAPAPTTPQSLSPATGDSSDVLLTFPGLNFVKDTKVVVVADAAAADETATVTNTVVPSGRDTLGSITASFDFVNLPPATPDLFQIFLTGPHGQRVWLGSISSV